MLNIKKILLVDDDKAFIYLAKLALRKYGVNCTIDEVHDGLDALNYLKNCTECPELILLDINMPVLDAYEFLKEFELLGKCTSTSNIFVLTSSSRPQDQIDLLANKLVSGYFLKPLNTQQIGQMLLPFEED